MTLDLSLSSLRPCLDVERSLGAARWVSAPADPHLVDRMRRGHDLPEIVARLLVSRGVRPESVASFLSPRLKDHCPDPFSLAGMDALAQDLAHAITTRKPMAIFGDFDVDGATSSAILKRFFRHFGCDVPIYIPDRLTEGYGPNVAAFQSLRDSGAALVLLCDCGITGFAPIASARDMGLDIVVLDHHETEETLPNATHVVDPKRRDCGSGLDYLAACGVVFLTCVAVNARLREQGYFQKTGIPEPPLKSWLDLVALGTVCDMVPLTGANRLFVRAGLSVMAGTANVGLRALMAAAGLKGAPDPYHAGFVLGPRINAGSRVHRADLGAQLLATDDPEEAKNIAWTLNDCNDKRKAIQATMIHEAEGMIAARGLDRAPVILLDHPDWHAGLAGLVAGHIKEKYGRPAIVIAYTTQEDSQGQSVQEGRGSGRSVAGVNLARIFIAARNAGLLIKGGGHAMAGGFTILPEHINAFRDFIYKEVEEQSAAGDSCTDTTIDGVLTPAGATPELARLLQDHIGPFGQANPEPVFAFPSVRVHRADIVGGAHVRAHIAAWEGGSALKAVAFRAADTPMGKALLSAPPGTLFHIAGTLKRDTWPTNQGKPERVEIHIRDMAPVTVSGTEQG